MNRKLPVDLSGLVSSLNLPGARLTFLTTALRSVWFEDRKFPGALGMETVRLRAEIGIRENLSFYGGQDDVGA